MPPPCPPPPVPPPLLPYAFRVCATRETPIFSPKFPLQRISFCTNPLQSITINIFAAPETTIFKISLPSSRFIAAHGRLTAASPNAKRSGRAPGLQPARVPARRVLQSQFRRPAFSRSSSLTELETSSLRSPAFSRSTRSRAPPPPFFTLPWQIPTKIWGECPPGMAPIQCVPIKTKPVLSVGYLHCHARFNQTMCFIIKGSFSSFIWYQTQWWCLNAKLKRNKLNSCMSKSICAE